MEITVNGMAVGFQLEEEKTLMDVVNQVGKWAAERELVLLEVIIDEDSYAPDDLEDRSLDTIKMLDFQLQSKADLVIGSLTEGAEYCQRVVDAVNKALEENRFSEENLDLLTSGISWISELAETIMMILSIEPEEIMFLDKPISGYLRELESFRAEIGQCAIQGEENLLHCLENKKGLFDSFRGIFRVLLLSDKVRSMIIRNIDSPDVIVQALAQCRDLLPAQIENLTEICALFQSGKDEEGARLLQVFLDFLQEYLRTTYQAVPVFELDPAAISVGGITLQEKNEQIHFFLKELMDVLENNDIISMSDILEYELKPVLANVGEYLEKLLASVGK